MRDGCEGGGDPISGGTALEATLAGGKEAIVGAFSIRVFATVKVPEVSVDGAALVGGEGAAGLVTVDVVVEGLVVGAEGESAHALLIGVPGGGEAQTLGEVLDGGGGLSGDVTGVISFPPGTTGPGGGFDLAHVASADFLNGASGEVEGGQAGFELREFDHHIG